MSHGDQENKAFDIRSGPPLGQTGTCAGGRSIPLILQLVKQSQNAATPLIT